MTSDSPARMAPVTRSGADGAYAFFALACGITWLLGLPLTLAWVRRVEAPPYALGLAGLSAFGPTLAAVVIAAPRRELGEVFGRWRTSPVWIVVGLLTPIALHLVATLLEVALGGQPARWFYPPVTPEHIAALVVFSIGEEFGWRGFAHPRMVRRHGPVLGSLLIGVVWALWHLLMMVSPKDGSFSFLGMGTGLIELPLYSVIIAWIFERADRSMAVAIAIHAGGHLDNVNRAPETEIRLRVLRLVVLVIAAAFAARALRARHAADVPYRP